MKRKDLFKKLISKAVTLTVETGEESIRIFQEHTSPKSVSKSHEVDQIDKKEPALPPKTPTKEQQKTKPSKSASSFRPPGLSYPPGAVKKFLSKCTGCSECVYSCPYGVIFSLKNSANGKNIPYIDVNSNPCRLCEDWPCIKSCDDGALKPVKKKEDVSFGLAKLNFSYCINSQTGEKTCTSCQEVCPIPKTVQFRKNKPNFANSCTGCGLCVQACPTYPKAIVVKQIEKKI
jgi:ferredoxin-type protein NapG